MVNKGPNNRVGKLYPTDNEALHANNKASKVTDTLSSPRPIPFQARYSTTPSTIPTTPKDTAARLPRYSPIAIKAAGTAISVDAPAYLGTRLVGSSGAALALSRNMEQYPASRPSKVP